MLTPKNYVSHEASIGPLPTPLLHPALIGGWREAGTEAGREAEREAGREAGGRAEAGRGWGSPELHPTSCSNMRPERRVMERVRLSVRLSFVRQSFARESFVRLSYVKQSFVRQSSLR